jgi:hypothetical protein
MPEVARGWDVFHLKGKRGVRVELEAKFFDDSGNRAVFQVEGASFSGVEYFGGFGEVGGR